MKNKSTKYIFTIVKSAPLFNVCVQGEGLFEKVCKQRFDGKYMYRGDDMVITCSNVWAGNTSLHT